jgi:hypothetical protein
MTEITLKLKDEIVKAYGEMFVKNFFEKQMEHLNLLQAMDKIEEEIKAADIDYEKELESIRKDAWKEYKEDSTKLSFSKTY